MRRCDAMSLFSHLATQSFHWEGKPTRVFARWPYETEWYRLGC